VDDPSRSSPNWAREVVETGARPTSKQCGGRHPDVPQHRPGRPRLDRFNPTRTRWSPRTTGRWSPTPTTVLGVDLPWCPFRTPTETATGTELRMATSAPGWTRVVSSRRPYWPGLSAARRTGGSPAVGCLRCPTSWSIEHPPGEEIQWDWLELPDPPAHWHCGDLAHLLVGSLPSSGKWRAVLADIEDQRHLIEALHAVSGRLGGVPKQWRFDRMATVVSPNTGRVGASFAAAKALRRSAQAVSRCIHLP